MQKFVFEYAAQLRGKRSITVRECLMRLHPSGVKRGRDEGKKKIFSLFKEGVTLEMRVNYQEY